MQNFLLKMTRPLERRPLSICWGDICKKGATPFNTSGLLALTHLLEVNDNLQLVIVK